MTLFGTVGVRARAMAAALLITLGVGVATPVAAEVLAFWDPGSSVDASLPLPPTSVSPNIASASNLVGGPGLTSPGVFANAYVLDNWSGGAFDPNDYLSFSTTGNGVTYQSVTFSLYNNFDGTGNWEIRSSVDGFATALDSGTFTGIFFAGLPITANVSAIGQQSGTVQFRIYTFNNTGATNPLQRGIRGTGGAAPGLGLSVNGVAAGGGVAIVAQSVPTLGTAQLALLVLLIGAGAFFVWRKRAMR
jgi:IPTL-CTERM motif